MPPEEVSTSGSNGCASPDTKQEVPPVSPDGPDIISELQHFAVGPGAQEPAVGTTGPQEMAPNAGSSASTNLASTNLASSKEAKTNANNCSGTIATTKVCMLNNHYDASLASTAQPSMDASTGQDLKRSSKHKSTTPPVDERASKLHCSSSLASQGFPFSGGYGIPPLDLNPAMLGRSMGHPLLMGTNSPYFQHPLGQMGEPCMMYPEMFGSGGAGIVPCSSALSTTSADTGICASSSVEMATSAVSALPQFMMSPSMAGMAGMLPSGFPLSYTQSLASFYPGAMHPGGLPGSAATPGPAGSSFLSKYPPTNASHSSPSSLSSSSPSAHFASRRGPVLVNNGGNLSATGSSEDDDDNDVIEVVGE